MYLNNGDREHRSNSCFQRISVVSVVYQQQPLLNFKASDSLPLLMGREKILNTTYMFTSEIIIEVHCSFRNIGCL